MRNSEKIRELGIKYRLDWEVFRRKIDCFGEMVFGLNTEIPSHRETSDRLTLSLSDRVNLLDEKIDLLFEYLNVKMELESAKPAKQYLKKKAKKK